MKLLIDTNIIIGLEDAGKTEERFADLLRKCSENDVRVFVHEASKEDIGRDKNADRKAATLSKIAKFQILERVANPSENDLAGKYGRLKNENDIVDAKLLYSLDIGAVDLLITEDDGLHRRAKNVGLNNRILTVADTLAWIKQTYEPEEVFLPAVKAIKAHGVKFSDPIFDELRSDYSGFDAWADKCVKEHRDCWVIEDGPVLAGIVIRKDEKHDEAGTENSGNNILKICTFKVAATYRGEKLGEQLLKQVLWHAQLNNYDLVYLTAYPKQASLIRLLEEYGFVQTHGIDTGEFLFEKPIGTGKVKPKSGENALETVRRTYPRFQDGADIRKFVVPIHPPYHAKLFPENTESRQGTTSKATGRPGNTIRKVYICHAATNQMRSGDLLFFYMTKSSSITSQSLTSVGVVESVRLTKNLEDARRWTAKRSVFSDEELSTWVAGTGPLKVIDFLLIGHLGPSLPLDLILDNGILNSWPQSITKLSSEGYEMLKPLLHLGFKF